MSLTVNGQTYSWGDVDVKIPGLVDVYKRQLSTTPSRFGRRTRRRESFFLRTSS